MAGHPGSKRVACVSMQSLAQAAGRCNRGPTQGRLPGLVQWTEPESAFSSGASKPASPARDEGRAHLRSPAGCCAGQWQYCSALDKRHGGPVIAGSAGAPDYHIRWRDGWPCGWSQAGRAGARSRLAGVTVASTRGLRLERRAVQKGGAGMSAPEVIPFKPD